MDTARRGDDSHFQSRESRATRGLRKEIVSCFTTWNTCSSIMDMA